MEYPSLRTIESKSLRGRLDEWFVADRIERFRAEGSRAAFLSGGDAVRAHLTHYGYPSARVHLRVVRGKIGARHGEIERRQTVRLVLGVQQLFRRPTVLGPRARPACLIRCPASRRRPSLAGRAAM